MNEKVEVKCPKCDSYDKTTKKCRANLDMEKIDCWGYTKPLDKLIESREDDYSWINELKKLKDKVLGVGLCAVVYDPSDYKIVKREKIEFWRKELLNKTDEVLKSMREVLGIE